MGEYNLREAREALTRIERDLDYVYRTMEKGTPIFKADRIRRNEIISICRRIGKLEKTDER